jgi:putative transposase
MVIGMRKTFKYRIYANKETISKSEQWLELCRSLYNCALAERIYAYKMQGVTLSGYTQMSELPDIKNELPEYKYVGSQVLQDVLDRLDKAYKNFFRGLKAGDKVGLPRFKGRNRYDSFTLKKSGWKIDGKYLSIRNIGIFKMRLSRPIDGKIKTITIRRTTTNKWYACFTCGSVPENKLSESDNEIGLDVGIKSFLTDSEGNKVENPKYLKHSLKELRVKQRKLARAIKFSNRRKKTKLQVSKLHEKITNQRSDFMHKLSMQYVKNYGTIYVEDLNIKGMVRNHKLARSINDAGWGTFISMLEYKAEEAGRQVVKIPRFEPSSKTCSVCGSINDNLKLSDRQWLCENCGTLHDRDLNAARNIKRVGQTH